jgi:hypothetical protein
LQSPDPKVITDVLIAAAAAAFAFGAIRGFNEVMGGLRRTANNPAKLLSRHSWEVSENAF